ncbi:amidohydrolase family protein [Ketogulonicigenium vulgare]|uniref:Putative N-acyl-D-glutamate deacylase protein n=1 Tax=Ketogulonicigenium vulgare (strain WSH-001) TaxID=759362 RepID=F9Y617_KETVW|nr:amidohydrolase family protein [Ketogulonicigenium vulgare]ADO42650.1 D-glutamate deacylase [Ketogulonicigenium vulgare Y25]AEM40842.1 putative N-acyl-D-glutamate deacylase protein [Ketogulonicigenium vulgare WSH-001]ALJ81005.1 D-glutamate deacylase [Ketogulonicigenium vulgare]ANW33771.1 D-glutamate deacylase [Ketogulonicigenium vulgare]AOZ54560.1 D-glutamate deacylase [Ketogulonicigenium vulgare]
MYDITLHGGRVIDPETGFDGIADVGITGDRIAAIAPGLPPGREAVDASGCIVAPGFIDIHAHGQSLAADRMQAFDGVTTSLELEVGVLPVARWYDEQAQRPRALNYGAGAAWLLARQVVLSGATLEGPNIMGRNLPNDRWQQSTAEGDEVTAIVDMVEAGIHEGALGIGVPNGYAPGSGVKEMVALCEMAGAHGAPTFTHVAFTAVHDPRSAIEAYIRIIGYAAATGAHMHICHLNSSSGTDILQAVEILKRAQAAGLPITTEAYPYGISSTTITAAFLTDPQYMRRNPKGYSSIMNLEGKRFGTQEALIAERQRDPRQFILTEYLDVDENPDHSAMMDASVLYPGGLIASDAMPWIAPDGTFYDGDAWPLPRDLSAHPRSSGTFTRFLRIWARERGAVDWPEAIAKCALYPAQLLEKMTPDGHLKGRLQVGKCADIVVFDPATITDGATFTDMTRPASGVKTLLVNGVSLIRDGALDVDAAPGRPVRGKVSA